MIAAFILCAGRGERLKDLTHNCPKPMLKIQGKPLLEHILINIKYSGIKNVFINVHYLKDQIIDYFGDGSSLGLVIQWSYEEQLLGTAGAAYRCENMLERFKSLVIFYGDIFTTQSLAPLIKEHTLKKALATIFVHKNNSSNSQLSLDHDGKIINFQERPTVRVADSKEYWANSGIYCLSSDALKYIPRQTPSDFPRDVFPRLLGKEFYGVPITSHRIAIDSIERYNQACLI